MMNFLFIDELNNAALIARDLATEGDAVGEIFVLAKNTDQQVWGHEKITYLYESWGIEEIIAFAKEKSVDITLNFNIILGKAGLVEAMQKEGLICLGTNKEFALMETDKKKFKSWLKANNINTPAILFEGLHDHLLVKANDLQYPCVVKPDSQIGPIVAVCQNQKDLEDYLQTTVQRIPYAKNAVLFMVEEYIPSIEVMGVLYYLCGDKAYLGESAKVLFAGKSDENLDGTMFTISPHPKIDNYREKIQQIIDKMTAFSSSGIGHIQCMIDQSGELYVIENNSRPNAYTFLKREKLFEFIRALKNKNGEQIPEPLLSYQYLGEQCQMMAFPLLHKEDQIKVDFKAINELPWLDYYPFSVTKEESFLSNHKRIPSCAVVTGKNYQEMFDTIEKNIDSLYAHGNFLPIAIDNAHMLSD